MWLPACGWKPRLLSWEISAIVTMSRYHDVTISRYLDVTMPRYHEELERNRASSICSPCLSRQQVCCAHCFCDANGVHILEILRVARNVQRRRGKVHKTARATINSMFISRDLQDFGETTRKEGMSGIAGPGETTTQQTNKQTNKNRHVVDGPKGFVWWTGKACPFSSSAIQNLIIIAQLMTLRDTLVYDSDNWSTYYFWFALSSGVFCFCLAKLYRSCPTVIKVHC